MSENIQEAVNVASLFYFIFSSLHVFCMISWYMYPFIALRLWRIVNPMIYLFSLMC